VIEDPFTREKIIMVPAWRAHPSACRGCYGIDIRFCQYQGKYERSAELLPKFMDEWAYGCQDCNAYIQKYIRMFGQEGLDR